MINIGDRVVLINDENSFIMQEKYKIGDFAIAMSDEYEGSFGVGDMFIDVKFEEKYGITNIFTGLYADRFRKV